MNDFFTQERNVQIVLSLLKAHNIKKVVVSPGSTNIAIVGSMQHDPYFEMYSCVDERSAAYMACGLAAESGEPVVLSCTGATASRNYYPALTEAFYRKLPILAITSSQDSRRLGHLKDQITDRSCPPKDVVNLSVCLQNVRDEMDEWDVTIKANRAILELWHRGGGPSHINLETTYCRTFSEKVFAPATVIRRYTMDMDLPTLPQGKIAVVVGTHTRMSNTLVSVIDSFCESNNAVVFCDHSSGYKSKYAVNYTLASYQRDADDNKNIELLIHIGETSGFLWSAGTPNQVWRVSPDGELRDFYFKLTNVFEMPEKVFFERYSDKKQKGDDSFLHSCLDTLKNVRDNFPEIPFSHIWVAQQLHDKFPQNSVVHFGILSPIRSWNFFNLEENVHGDCNQGGFGIDGNISTLIGASLVHKEKLYFGVVGDLSFFYDMNSIGNRHVGNNVRIMIINNGLGCEFRLFNQVGNILGCETDAYISAAGHYGNKSQIVVKNYAESLGYKYLSCSSKESFLDVYKEFVNPKITDAPMIFEIFTEVEKENESLKTMSNILKTSVSSTQMMKNRLKAFLGKR